MRKAFEPAGEAARWKTLYDHLVNVRTGDTVTYQQFSEWLGYDFREDRSPYYRANKELLLTDQRTLKNVQGVGYQVVDATEHGELARLDTRAADKKVQKAIRLLTNADRNQLSPELATAYDAMAGGLSGVRDMTRRLSRRQDKLEGVLKAVRRETKADVAGLDDRLSRLEKLLREEAPQQ